jgi:hypothetical protein
MGKAERVKRDSGARKWTKSQRPQVQNRHPGHPAFEIDRKVYGVDHPLVAIFANNIGMILQDRGDLDGALRYTQMALGIATRVYGAYNPTTRKFAANLEAIRRAMK